MLLRPNLAPGAARLEVRRLAFRRLAAHRLASRTATPTTTTLSADGVEFLEDAVTETEAATLLRDVDAQLAAKRFERGHFDAVIRDYREAQMPDAAWSPESARVLDRLRDVAQAAAGTGLRRRPPCVGLLAAAAARARTARH